MKNDIKKNEKNLYKNVTPCINLAEIHVSDPTIHSYGEGAMLEVGSFAFIASGVQIFLGGEHRIDWVTTFSFNILKEEGKNFVGHPKTKGDVLIGNDVWIATEAIIMSGLTIGDGAVIGARAVVTRNVPPYTVVADKPAKEVKKRFDDITIQRLLEIKWWNWNDSKIKAALPL